MAHIVVELDRVTEVVRTVVPVRAVTAKLFEELMEQTDVAEVVGMVTACTVVVATAATHHKPQVVLAQI